jgi:protein-S-isoprenylcysteine O-methyltransferase Ste14
VIDTPVTTLLSVRATKFEFEKRFWIICAIYFIGFYLSVFDHTPFIAAIRHLIAPSIEPGSLDADRFARVVIAIGALLVFLSAALRTWGAAYLRTAIVHDTAQHFNVLVADGPFRYTRNPLYLASLPMAAGIGVLASVSGFIFLVLANWIFVYRLSLREEGPCGKARANRIVPIANWCRGSGRHSGRGFRPEIVDRNGARHWEAKVLSGYLGWLNC